MAPQSKIKALVSGCDTKLLCFPSSRECRSRAEKWEAIAAPAKHDHALAQQSIQRIKTQSMSHK